MKVTYTINQTQALFKQSPAPWWIAGGWAIDLFLGRTTREHEDIDVAILRDDEQVFRKQLKDWEIWPGLGNSQLENKPIAVDDKLSDNREVLWCRPSPEAGWSFELLLNKTAGDDWVFKRDSRVRKPIEEIGSLTSDGIPYLNPEIVLLFKAKNNQTKDRHDFEHAVPKLSEEAKEWLRDSLHIVHPNHLWLNDLS
jgi:hypothetical protein